MIVKVLLLGTILFHFSALGRGVKFLIAPANNIPEDVQSAMQAMGLISAGGFLTNMGFFINEGVFVSPISNRTASAQTSHGFIQFKEADFKDSELIRSIKEGDMIQASAGRATIIRDLSHWGVFEVDHERREGLVIAEPPKRFLTFSDFANEDRIFILSPHLYDHREPGSTVSRKRNLIMEVPNLDIQDIGKNIDFEQSPTLKIHRHKLHGSIAVNQRGEVIGFMELIAETNRLTPFNSDLISLFSDTAKEILEGRQKPIRNTQTPTVELAISPAEANLPERGVFQQCLFSLMGKKARDKKL